MPSVCVCVCVVCLWYYQLINIYWILRNFQKWLHTHERSRAHPRSRWNRSRSDLLSCQRIRHRFRLPRFAGSLAFSLCVWVCQDVPGFAPHTRPLHSLIWIIIFSISHVSALLSLEWWSSHPPPAPPSRHLVTCQFPFSFRQRKRQPMEYRKGTADGPPRRGKGQQMDLPGAESQLKLKKTIKKGEGA